MINEKTMLLLHWLSREKKAVYSVYGLAVLQGAMYISIPLTLQGIVTYTMAGKFSASLLLLSVLTVVVSALIGLFQLWQMRLNETLQEKIFCRLTEGIGSLQEQNKTTANLEYFFEVVTLQKGIGKILLEFSFSVISIIFGLLILPAYSSWFLIFSVLLGFVFFLVVSYYGKKAQHFNLSTSTKKYTVYNSIRYNEGDLNQELLSYLAERKSYYKVFEQQYKGILFFKVFFISILLFLGTYLVQIGELNIGQFVASEIIILLVINSVEKLVGSLGTCYDIITGLYKLEQLFKDAPHYSFLRGEGARRLPASNKVYKHNYPKIVKRVWWGALIGGALILLFPWTQTISMSGTVSALNPENKPQQVTSRIAGRVEKWFIRDGAYVHKGDTIAFLSEIKEEYMDSLLVDRSEAQVKAKESTIDSYQSKIRAINEQIDALNKSQRLKTEQVRNKIRQVQTKLASDSVEAQLAANNSKVAEEQFKRFEQLLEKGLVSRTEYENRKVKLQEASTKKVAADNKVIATRNELLNAELEINSNLQEFNEKLMKAESDKYSTMSALYESEGTLTKLQNSLSNYSLRSTYYHVLAPQDGYIHNVRVNGIGEIVKEGGMLCMIVPPQREQAVELFVDPIDLPLIAKGGKVQLIFDGWPAFVFSGWPNMSYGSFTAEIISYDKVISENGKFRVLAKNHGKPWPEAIQIGGGVKGMALLKDVPLFYELWRRVNGFPPEFYKQKTTKTDADK